MAKEQRRGNREAKKPKKTDGQAALIYCGKNVQRHSGIGARWEETSAKTTDE